MNKIYLLLIISVLFVSCKAQNETPKSAWKNISFDEAGFTVDFPCEPKRSFKSFQEKPRPIRVFSYECEYQGTKYLASLKEHMDAYDEKRVPQQLKAIEDYLPELFKEKNLEVVFLKREDSSRGGFPARFFDAEIGGKDRWRQLTFVTDRGVFDVTAVLIVNKGDKRTDELENKFDSESKIFIDSFRLQN